MEEKIYWVWISMINELNNNQIYKLLEIYKTPKKIWGLSKKELKNVLKIDEQIAQKILEYKYNINLEKYIKYMEKRGIDIISIQDVKYPSKLKNIYDCPIVIYTKGNQSLLNEFSIGIIGCRFCSKYGERIAKKISYDLSQKQVCIISGLAKGIDTHAHLGCIKSKGKTIAVLGNGLDDVYPKENEKIAEEIVKTGGLIISEYAIGTKPLKQNFPARNRIISGLSDGIVVIEAKQRSGTFITVDYALEQGKEVFSVPGNITSIDSAGTNLLIKQGAKLVTCVEDILEEYEYM